MYGIAVDATGHVYVSSKTYRLDEVIHDRINKYSSDGQLLTSWDIDNGKPVERVIQWNHGSNIAVDAAGKTVYIQCASPKNYAPYIRKYTSEGKFLAEWPYRPSALSKTGFAAYVNAMCVAPDGNLYFVDNGKSREIQDENFLGVGNWGNISKYSPTGELLGVWSFNPHLQTGYVTVCDITVDASGTVYVSADEGGKTAIYRFIPRQGYVTEVLPVITVPASTINSDAVSYLTLDGKGVLYQLNSGQHSVNKFML